MPHEEWAEPAPPAALWSATLSSRQRVLFPTRFSENWLHPSGLDKPQRRQRRRGEIPWNRRWPSSARTRRFGAGWQFKASVTSSPGRKCWPCRSSTPPFGSLRVCPGDQHRFPVRRELSAALATRFVGLRWQHCQFHLRQNIRDYVPKGVSQTQASAELRSVFNAPNRSEAGRVLDQMVKKYTAVAPRLAASRKPTCLRA